MKKSKMKKSKMKKKLLTLSCVAAIASIIGVIFYFLFIDQKVVFAKLTDKSNNDILVVGKYEDFIDGWSVMLCWRKYADGPWMLYYLDHESEKWQHIELLSTNGSVKIKRKNYLVGKLNVNNGSYYNAQKSTSVSHPMAIVLNDDPFNKRDRLYPESADWDTVWPSVLKNK